MSNPFSIISMDQIIQIAIYVLILAVVWVIFKAIFKTTMRIFTFGCGAIVVLAVILLVIRYLNGL
jgi:hypothetical protein